MKYVIEIDEKHPFLGANGEQLYRVKGFNSLVFDHEGLSRLKKYEDVFTSDLSAISKEVLRIVEEDQQEPKLDMDVEKRFIYDRPKYASAVRNPIAIEYDYPVINKENLNYVDGKDISDAMDILTELQKFYN